MTKYLSLEFLFLFDIQKSPILIFTQTIPVTMKPQKNIAKEKLIDTVRLENREND
jgi:hypothetical protein